MRAQDEEDEALSEALLDERVALASEASAAAALLAAESRSRLSELLSIRGQAREREASFARETAGKMLGLAGQWLADQERVGLEATTERTRKAAAEAALAAQEVEDGVRRELRTAVAEVAVLGERLEGQRVMFTRELKEFAETSRLSIEMLQSQLRREVKRAAETERRYEERAAMAFEDYLVVRVDLEGRLAEWTETARRRGEWP